MSWPTILIAFLVLGALFVYIADFPKTLFLIAKVSPYEQAGSGAGSILVIGDSTAYGTGASRNEDSVAGRIGADYPQYSITTNAVNGRKTEGAMEALSEVSGKYDLLVFQIGANNLLAGEEVQVVVEKMKTLIEAAQAHSDNIVVLTSGNIGAVPRFTGERREQFTNISRDYQNAMLELTKDYENVSYVPLFDEIEDDIFLKDPEVYIASDGLHPTSAGYAVWYTKAKLYISEVLQ